MEWITEFFSDGTNASLMGFSGGGIAALILFISNTIRRIIFRIVFTSTATLAGLFGGAYWMGFEMQPMEQLSEAQLERQEKLADWQNSLFSLLSDGMEDGQG